MSNVLLQVGGIGAVYQQEMELGAKELVWGKGIPVRGYHPSQWRKDVRNFLPQVDLWQRPERGPEVTARAGAFIVLRCHQRL
jgi:hypothetical protein